MSLESKIDCSNEENRHPPKYCPNCGAEIKNNQPYWSNSDWLETEDKPFYGTGYDCYCDECKWSGYIEPDSDSEFYKLNSKMIEKVSEVILNSEKYLTIEGISKHLKFLWNFETIERIIKILIDENKVIIDKNKIVWVEPSEKLKKLLGKSKPL